MNEDAPIAAIAIRPVEPRDAAWIDATIAAAFGAPLVVSRGVAHRPSALDGFVAEREGVAAGVVTLHADGDACEVVSLNSLVPGGGVGRALIGAAAHWARGRGCRRLWLITTNDNTRALRFYQRLGMRLTAVHLGALEDAHRLKPEIPLTGEDGIPIRDEIELSLAL